MRPGLQTPASVNATLALASSLLCSSTWRAACRVGLRYVKAPLANSLYGRMDWTRTFFWS